MESSEAINQVEVAAGLQKRGALIRSLRGWFNPVINRMMRRPLFQKVIIANTVLIAVGTFMGIYLEKTYFASAKLDFLSFFIVIGVTLTALINYLLAKLAFRPLDDVTDTLKSIRAGQRHVRVPVVKGDTQIAELSQSLNFMLNALEHQRKRDAASAIKAQEEERKRIARELHDETSQSLTGLVIGIKMVEELVPDSMPQVKRRLGSITDLAHQTLNEVHTMAARLRPSVLDDLGLAAALRSYIMEFSENTGIKVETRLLTRNDRLQPELETVLYRVVQEALTNVARHAGASKCTVKLERAGGELRGQITDNGHGFDPEKVLLSTKSRGLGLHGMQERIELVGGSLRFESRPSKGSTIHLEVPTESKEGII